MLLETKPGDHVRTIGSWQVCLALSLLLACSSGPGDEKGALKGGPAAPELSFSTDGEPVEAAPISLTGSDGTGLRLVSITAKTVIDDPLAFTELHLTFHNPEPRVREGRFAITLPTHAAISRFAMETATGLQEGEVVERRRAQEVYEDFLHRKQDPALLEHAAGNAFSARVFPIAPNAEKKIIVAYSEERPSRKEPYRLLLRGLPKLDQIDVEVRLGSSSATGLESSATRDKTAFLRFSERNYVPKTDLEVRLPEAPSFALRSDELVVMRVSPVADLPPANMEGLTVLVDTSASRALGLGAQVERLGKLVARLAEARDFSLRILAFDQEVEEVYRGSARAFSLRDQAKLLARDALGATDLTGALAYLAQRPDGHARLLLVSDGVITAFTADTTSLREAVATLAAHGLRRLDVLAEGGIRDDDTLGALTRAGLAETGVVIDARLPLATVQQKLMRSARAEVQVHVPGATWLEPSVLESVQPGDERLVFAELPRDMPVQVELGDGSAVTLPTLEAPGPLLTRAWARAKIATLTRELSALRDAQGARANELRTEIVALSTRHRVLSDFTALLVLESTHDYVRFNIEQKALSHILEVGEEGLQLIDRTKTPLRIAVGEGTPPSDFEDNALWPGEPLELPTTARREETSPRDKQVAARSAPAASRKMPMAETPPARKPSAPSPLRELAGSESARSAGAPVAASVVSAASGSARGASDIGTSRAKAAAGALRLPEARPLTLHVAMQVTQSDGLDADVVTRAVRSPLLSTVRRCHAQAPGQPEGSFALRFELNARGEVANVVTDGTVPDPQLKTCLLSAARAIPFPKPERDAARVRVRVAMTMREQAVAAAQPTRTSTPRAPAHVPPSLDDAYTGVLKDVLEALQAGDVARAANAARTAREQDPSDVIALIALGEVLEAQQDLPRAARAYGSIIDLFPARADLRRMAGARLERLGALASALAVDTYRRAVEQRPDHPSAHRLLAYALVRTSQHAEAFEVLRAALARGFPGNRFPGVERILREDLGLIAAAWLRVDATQKDPVLRVLAEHDAKLPTKPSLRFVLNWETDANDVDFHIHDGLGGHAYYVKKKLPSGGELYADITTGYGPECFAIEGKARAYPYILEAHYFARGPMGYGMGKLQVLEHDGQGTLRFRDHPFVIMRDKAFVSLAKVERPLLEES